MSYFVMLFLWPWLLERELFFGFVVIENLRGFFFLGGGGVGYQI